MKICKICKVSLPFEEFYTSKNHLDGYRAECKPCTSIYWKNKNRNSKDNFKVYLIKDKKSDEILYVGQTSQTLMKRFRDHIGDQKFTRGEVKMELVKDNLIEAEALTLERLLINQYNPPENAYKGYAYIEKPKPTSRKGSEKQREAARLAKSRPIICLNDGKVWDSIRSACNFYGLSEPKVCQVAQGKRPHTKKYRFEYL